MLELLSPAKNLDCGIAAINAGADAVYIGAPKFGAREAAGNTMADIAALAAYAHRYWARVYLALNTLLRDHELDEAVRLAHQAYEAGVDALVVQDVGLLECDLPPLPLIASTQMHNHTPARVAFLERVGFRRAILARELELVEIAAIHKAAPRIELEAFIHGALCVGYSGQCYLSYALGGRSGNRGQCAQPCRKAYRLIDGQGQTIQTPGAHLLSIQDLNATERLSALIEAGVTSFKIEGRLKDQAYVTNIVAHYRRELDALMARRRLRRSSSGETVIDFAPDPAKTFQRGYTTHFLLGRSGKIGAPRTPKMVGEPVGRVVAIDISGTTIEGGNVALHPGDGVCFFNRAGELCGTTISRVDGPRLYLEDVTQLRPGTRLFRNHDHEFLARLKRARIERRIRVELTLSESPEGLVLAARDEDGVAAQARWTGETVRAEKPDVARAAIQRQLAKSGETEFVVENCTMAGMENQMPFLPVAALNALRRDVLENLRAAREEKRPRWPGGMIPNDAPFLKKELSFTGNVLNAKAAAFYRRHGVEKIEPAAESGLNLLKQRVMTTRYCLKYELDLCPKQKKNAPVPEPLCLIDEEGNELALHFNCRTCRMAVFFQARRKHTG